MHLYCHIKLHAYVLHFSFFQVAKMMHFHMTLLCFWTLRLIQNAAFRLQFCIRLKKTLRESCWKSRQVRVGTNEIFEDGSTGMRQGAVDQELHVRLLILLVTKPSVGDYRHKSPLSIGADFYFCFWVQARPFPFLPLPSLPLSLFPPLSPPSHPVRSRAP